MKMSKLSIILVILLMNPRVLLTMLTNPQTPWKDYRELVETVKGGIIPFCQELKDEADKYMLVASSKFQMMLVSYFVKKR